ncbi:MAG: DUF1800 domain-containing protein [Bacteroidota bacterium]|nr:DUF1800 domain-containing protein [Bacteroidota bacterium]
MATEEKKLQHLLARAGFGATPSLLNRFRGKDLAVVVSELLKDSEIIQDLLFLAEPETNDEGEVRPLKVVSLFVKSQKQKEQLNFAWIDRMSVAKAQLREKMILFWHNHFASSGNFAYLLQVQHNMLRKHALGSFREMLHEISKDPTMILWLNNQQNKKNAPNENFAREVMELFTLGEGNGYKENDIKNAARAFTGWAVNKKGEFEFKENQHDFDEKEVFGKKGNFNGEDIINMLLEKPQLAEHICRKVYRTFVNSEVDESHVKELAARFRSKDYDIGDLMRTIFVSDWFNEDKNIGCIIVSPVELIVRFKKLCKLEVDDEQMTALQQVLGQTLFLPPNVAGWKGGRGWIDASSLAQRLHLPKAMLDAGTARLNKKPVFEETSDAKQQDDRTAKVKSDWTMLTNYFYAIDDKSLTDEVIKLLILAPTDRIDKKRIEAQVDVSTKEKRIITTLVAVMQTPEFQII